MPLLHRANVLTDDDVLAMAELQYALRLLEGAEPKFTFSKNKGAE